MQTEKWKKIIARNRVLVSEWRAKSRLIASLQYGGDILEYVTSYLEIIRIEASFETCLCRLDPNLPTPSPHINFPLQHLGYFGVLALRS